MIPFRLRQRILKIQNSKCAYCNASIDIKNSHMDHIICRKKHGDDRKGNLNLTCSMCNRAKHDLPLIKLFEWFEHIQNTNISNLKKFSLLKEKQVLKSIKRNPFYILPSPERKAKERRKSYQRKLIIGLRNKIKRDQSIFI